MDLDEFDGEPLGDDGGYDGYDGELLGDDDGGDDGYGEGDSTGTESEGDSSSVTESAEHAHQQLARLSSLELAMFASNARMGAEIAATAFSSTAW